MKMQQNDNNKFRSHNEKAMNQSNSYKRSRKQNIYIKPNTYIHLTE